MNETLGMDGTLPERMRMMPSSLNDACRTLEAGAEKIEQLYAALSELAAGFEDARDRCTYMAEAQRLDGCAKFCRSFLPLPSKSALGFQAPQNAEARAFCSVSSQHGGEP